MPKRSFIYRILLNAVIALAVVTIPAAFYYRRMLGENSFEVVFKVLRGTRITHLSGETAGNAADSGHVVFKAAQGTYVLKFTHPDGRPLVRPITIRRWVFSPILDFTSAQQSKPDNRKDSEPDIYNARNRLEFEPETVLIPAGKFTMGVRKGEGPSTAVGLREIYLSDYAIGKYEISNRQFAAFVDDTGFVTDAEKDDSGYAADVRGPWRWRSGVSWRKPFLNWERPPDFESLPVVMVSWRDAEAYTHWLSRKTGKSYRLPTEAEWEKAARGIDGRFYPWGDDWQDLNRYCNHGKYVPGFEPGAGDDRDGYLLLAPVDSFSAGASPYGIRHMVGNAKEWVYDKFAMYDRLSDDLTNPRGPAESAEQVESWGTMTFTGHQRVLRGGGWYDGPGYGLTATYRNGHPEQLRFSGVGFRIVQQISK